MNIKQALFRWFVWVSIMSIGIVFLVQIEPSFIILNIFIAPMSIVIALATDYLMEYFDGVKEQEREQ